MNIELVRLVLALVASISWLVFWSRLTRTPIFFGLLSAGLVFAVIDGIAITDTLTHLQSGFGTLLGQIGIVVVLGTVLGTLLEKSGAMNAVSQGLSQLLGARKSLAAILITGVIVGIPVFCDSGFIILSGLLPALAMTSGISGGSLRLALAGGLYTTHTLVPPTPGPLTAAANFGAASSIGMVIAVGLLVTIPVSIVVYLYARRFGGSMVIEEAATERPSTNLSAGASLWPLLLPVLLIAIGSVPASAAWPEWVAKGIHIAGTPAVALAVGVLMAIPLYRKQSTENLDKTLSIALREAGIILLITGAGGAFGAVIKAGGLASLLQQYVPSAQVGPLAFIAMCWLLAALLKTAQGSSTSAMIVTSAMMMPLASAAGMVTPFQLAVAVIATGGGAMAVSHANDSYFWVVTRFGHLRSEDAMKYFTRMTLVQGITVLLCCLLLSLL